ncbi:MAG: hypothetical protein GQ527_10390 [Bacteroidales bacterium]|nr:hypothetical protein [Bacteroidales bacterium]
MTKYYKILAAVLILFTLYAPSCVNEEELNRREETMFMEAKENVLLEFGIRDLSETSLFVFEASAKQKIFEIGDYIKVLTDTALAISFREKSGEMIQGNFISEDVMVGLSMHDIIADKVPLQQYINQALDNKIINRSFSFDSIITLQPLYKTGDDIYTGKLQFIQNTSYFYQSTHVLNSADREVAIYLIKEPKIFGTDTLDVWNIRFGDIK